MAWFPPLFTRRRRYSDLSASIQEHLAEKIDELMEEGMPRAQAEQAARKAFGNVALIEQRSREAWHWPALESVVADLRFALRQLIKSPGFTVTAVLTLALGIAVNATIFSLVDGFLLPHLPGRNAESIAVISSVNPDQSFLPDTNPVSVPNYLAWRNDTHLFADMAAGDQYRTGSLAVGGQPEAIQYAAVTPNYFSLFGAASEL